MHLRELCRWRAVRHRGLDFVLESRNHIGLALHHRFEASFGYPQQGDDSLLRLELRIGRTSVPS
jgi:hypothetical protein